MNHQNGDNKKNPVGVKNTHYFNAAQLRLDLWNNLKHSVRQLDSLQRSGADYAEVQHQVDYYLSELAPFESYWAFPGDQVLYQLRNQFNRMEFRLLAASVVNVVRALASETYRQHNAVFSSSSSETLSLPTQPQDGDKAGQRHYFEVLIVDNLPYPEANALRQQMLTISDPDDQFGYDIVLARSYEDALIAVMLNPHIQSCVIRYNFPLHSALNLKSLHPLIAHDIIDDIDSEGQHNPGPHLGAAIRKLRPELDLFWVTDVPIQEVPDGVHQHFRRVFYRLEDYLELHLSLLHGIKERFDTPFFTALKEYSQRPTGVFHAMPVSRGNSIFKSHWIQDMGDFYGNNIFLAETSATTGGLDSLLQPTGPLKEAQEMASTAFGSQHTFFSTNGTSTSNKIVLQALVEPGDIVLIDRDCHKSHHYGLVLSGAYPVYLDSYPVKQYSLYGGVPLKQIKRRLLELKRAGRLDRVKMLLLTNCTFDGLVYNVERVMEEVLAIKPDMVFLWDEAWFGFAYFTPTYRQRTAMDCARRLYERYQSTAYRQQYKRFKKRFDQLDQEDENTWLDNRLLPDPDLVRIRTYADQSTHKKLSALRQGAMIHVWDQDFRRKVEANFHEAYMTHTSTSPNYQILASLDLARRQAQFEGYELVQKSVEMAMTLRSKITDHPLLQRYFDILATKDLIPAAYRASGIEQYYNPESGWSAIDDAWQSDEFVLDPTHINLYIGKTGIDGDTFKSRYLMDQFGIQVNKTTRNTVLFMTNIGTTRSSVAYLVGVLLNIAHQLEQDEKAFSPAERKQHEQQVQSFTIDLPPLPDFSCFHPAFRPAATTPEGDMRTAYFMAYSEEKCEFIKMGGALEKALDAGRQVVSASFVIPYPPGFPLLVPGQTISAEILDFMKALDVKEIHGYRPDLGFRVFTEAAISELAASNQPPAPKTRKRAARATKNNSAKK